DGCRRSVTSSPPRSPPTSSARGSTICGRSSSRRSSGRGSSTASSANGDRRTPRRTATSTVRSTATVKPLPRPRHGATSTRRSDQPGALAGSPSTLPCMRYGYLGPETTFTHQALLQALAAMPEEAAAQVEAVPFSAVATATTDLLAGDIDAMMAPIENSVEGGVSGTLDVLAATDAITIVAEQVVQVSVALAARSAPGLDRIEVVSSAPHAQAQAQGGLRNQGPQAHGAASSSTAAAARGLAALSPDQARGRAAVCSRLAAEHF